MKDPESLAKAAELANRAASDLAEVSYLILVAEGHIQPAREEIEANKEQFWKSVCEIMGDESVPFDTRLASYNSLIETHQQQRVNKNQNLISPVCSLSNIAFQATNSLAMCLNDQVKS